MSRLRLSRLTAEGLHAGGVPAIDQAIESPLVLVVGLNEAGKTTMISLPNLALDGPTGSRWPVLGTSPSYDFATSVRFELDDGKRVLVGRGIDRGKHWASLDGRPGGLKDVQGRIDATFGRARTFDLGAFTSLTPPKRLEWLEASVLDSGGWDRDRLRAELDADRLPALVAAVDLDVDTLLTEDNDARTGLVNLIEAVKKAALDADRDVKRLDASIAQQRAEKDATELPPGTVAQWRDTIRKLQTERSALVEKRGQIQGVKSALEAHQKALVEVARAIEESRARIVAAEEELAAARAGLPPLDAEAIRLADAAGPATVAAKEANDKAEAEAVKLREALERGESPEAVQTMATSILGMIANRRDEFEAAGPEVAAERWLRHLRALAEAASNLPNRTAYDEAAAAAAATISAYGAAKEAASEAARVLTAATKEVARKEKALGRIHADLVRQEQQAAQLQAAQLDSEASGEEGVTEAIKGLDQNIADATGNADTLTDAATATALRMERSLDRDRATQKRTDARSVVKGLTAVLERMLAEVIRPFVDPISRITSAVVDADCYVDLAGGFDFGCLRPDGTRVPWATCSESQQAVLLLAFAVAVQGRLGGWRRLVVDGLECMDAERRTRFLTAMREAVDRDELDTLICAVVDDGWTPPIEAAAQVVRLERGTP